MHILALQVVSLKPLAYIITQVNAVSRLFPDTALHFGSSAEGRLMLTSLLKSSKKGWGGTGEGRGGVILMTYAVIVTCKGLGSLS